MSSKNNFDYYNSETKQVGGMKIIRKVSVKNGKGYKKVTKYRKGKKVSSVKKPIHNEHLRKIKDGVFIVGLFDDCKECGKTRKKR